MAVVKIQTAATAQRLVALSIGLAVAPLAIAVVEMKLEASKQERADRLEALVLTQVQLNAEVAQARE